MIVLSVGHARPHTVAISDSFSDDSAPGAMNVKYRSALNCASAGPASIKSSCQTEKRGVSARQPDPLFVTTRREGERADVHVSSAA